MDEMRRRAELRELIQELARLPLDQWADAIAEHRQWDPELTAELASTLHCDEPSSALSALTSGESGHGGAGSPAGATRPCAEGGLGAEDGPGEPSPPAGPPPGPSGPDGHRSITGYRLIQVIGTGGMGVVYLAQQTAPVVRRVALKVIKLGMDTRQVLGRFETERQTLAVMDHVNIAKIYDAGSTDDGRPYFAMEYVSGLSILRHCDHHRLQVRDRLKLFLQVCHGVQHAHFKGVIHRDLKPSNILVSTQDDTPIAKIIDFGLARATDRRMAEETVYTRLGFVVGTPMYMSPEQADTTGIEVDHRTDIYSLGVILYQLLVGELPVDWGGLPNAAFDEAMRIVREEEPLAPNVRYRRLNEARSKQIAAERGTDPHSLCRQIRGDLEWIVMKSMSKERGRRYMTVSELAGDVERFLAGEPVLAGPPSGLYRFRKFIQKNRAPVAVSAGLFAIMTLGLVAASFYARSERAARLEVESRTLAERQTYLACLKSAAFDMESGDFAGAGRWLDYCRDHLSGYCGWEWGHLDLRARQFVSSTRLEIGESAPPRGTASSADGKLFCEVLGADLVVKETAGGKTIAKIPRQGDRIICAAFDDPGDRVAVGTMGGRVRVWRLRPVEETTGVKGPKDVKEADAVADLTDEGASTGPAESRPGWDVEEERDPVQHTTAITAVAFSHDGSRIAAGTNDSLVRTWLVQDPEAVRELRGHENWVESLAFAPDDRKVVSGSYDRTVRIWDVETACLEATFRGHGDGIYDVSFDKQGFLISRSRDGSKKVWNPAVRSSCVTLVREEGCNIGSIAVTRDGEFVAAGGSCSGESRGLLRVWRTDTSDPVLDAGSAPIASLCLSQDGRYLVSAASTALLSRVKVWDFETGHPLVEEDLPARDRQVHSTAFRPDGTQVACGTLGGEILLWDFQSGDPPHEWRVGRSAQGDKISSLCYSPDGSLLIAGCWDGTVRVARPRRAGGDDAVGAGIGSAGETDATADAAEDVIFHAHDGKIEAVAFSPDGRRFASASYDGSVKIWAPEDGGWREARCLAASGGKVFAIAFSPDGKRLASGSQRGTIRIWDPDGQAGDSPLATLQCGGDVKALTFSGDGKHLFASSWAGSRSEIRIWTRDHEWLFRRFRVSSVRHE